MSWSRYFKVEAGTDPSRISELAVAEAAMGNGECPEERARAVDAAAEAAENLIASGALGNLAAQGFSVSLSGHCNPGNRPTEGRGNDTISISISQITPPPDATQD